MYRHSRKKKKNNIYSHIFFVILVACLIYISIGYAFYTQNVNILGNVKIINYIYEEGDLTVTYTWTETGWEIYDKKIYRINVTVTNNTNHIVDGWKVTFDFPETAEVQYAYNCNYSKDDPSSFYCPTYSQNDDIYNVLLDIGNSIDFQIDVAILGEFPDLDPIGTSEKKDDPNTNTTNNTNTSNTIENNVTNSTNTVQNATNTNVNTNNTTGEQKPDGDKILTYLDPENGVYLEIKETLVWGEYSSNFTFDIYNNNTTTIKKWYIELIIPDGVSDISFWGGNATTTGNIITLGSGTEVWNTYPIEPGTSFSINGQISSTSRTVVPIVSKVIVEL